LGLKNTKVEISLKVERLKRVYRLKNEISIDDGTDI